VTERTTLAAELQAVMARKGATEWSKVLDVDRTTVHKWWAGDAYPRGRQLEAIARETGRQLRFVADTTKEPPPAWAETLPKDVAAEVMKRIADPEMLARAAAELRLAGQPPDAPRNEGDAAPPDTGHTAQRRPGKQASR
jgi:hypothetical protein